MTFMDAFKISEKIFVADDHFAPDQFVRIFHRWIQTGAIDGHLLIDVADYAHVADGPGTVLIGSEANFYMDRGENRLGLLYSRKTPLPGPFRDRLRAVLVATFQAATKLESEDSLPGGITFRTDEIVIRVNDRLLAPSHSQTLQATGADVESVARQIHGGDGFTLEPRIDPLKLFEIRLKSEQNPPIKTVLDRLGAAGPALSR